MGVVCISAAWNSGVEKLLSCLVVMPAKTKTLIEKASLADSAHDFEEAESLFNDALHRCLNTTDPELIAQCYRGFAAFLVRRGRVEEGARMYRLGQIIYKSTRHLEPAKHHSRLRTMGRRYA